MKKVSEQEWKQKAAGLAKWRKNKTTPPNLELYKRIVSMVHVGTSVADVGCGQCHLKKFIPFSTSYYGVDPFPIVDGVDKNSAENWSTLPPDPFDTVFMLAALDNVRDVELSLIGLKRAAKENIVILTGIGIPPDENHTVQIDRKDLTDVLGEPAQEIEISKGVFLFEWKL